jgi:hypothetical protein
MKHYCNKSISCLTCGPNGECLFGDGRCTLSNTAEEKRDKILAFIDAGIGFCEDGFQDEAVRQLNQAKDLLMGKSV